MQICVKMKMFRDSIDCRQCIHKPNNCGSSVVNKDLEPEMEKVTASINMMESRLTDKDKHYLMFAFTELAKLRMFVNQLKQ